MVATAFLPGRSGVSTIKRVPATKTEPALVMVSMQSRDPTQSAELGCSSGLE